MRVLSYHHSSFDRQVQESVEIQIARKEHLILNSKSEYNRCALPRLGVQLGEKEFKEKIEK